MSQPIGTLLIGFLFLGTERRETIGKSGGWFVHEQLFSLKRQSSLSFERGRL